MGAVGGGRKELERSSAFWGVAICRFLRYYGSNFPERFTCFWFFFCYLPRTLADIHRVY